MKDTKPGKPVSTGIVDNAGIHMSGHIMIRDRDSGEVLINKRNAIHYGNMARIIALALNNTPNAWINFMAFGNGGTSVDTTGGKVLYRSPRVTEAYEASSGLYNKTYHKDIAPGNPENPSIQVITGPSFTDIVMRVELGFSEPNGTEEGAVPGVAQEVFDTSVTNEGAYIFDEMGIFTNPINGSADSFNDAVMLTHVIFHPVQKSQNRAIEIIYTIRVQLS
jgi:hypothetical protein